MAFQSAYDQDTGDATFYPPPHTDPVRTNFRFDPFSGVSSTSVQELAPTHHLMGLLLLGGVILAFEWLRKRK